MGNYHNTLNEFESVVDRVYGIYLDGTRGFGLVRKDIKETSVKLNLSSRIFSPELAAPRGIGVSESHIFLEAL